jgi:murein DD-endopeptidase MepM/ murein hydrolase activator NlpD
MFMIDLKREDRMGRKDKKKWITFMGVFLLLLSSLVYFFFLPAKPVPPPPPSTAPTGPPRPPSPEPPQRVIEGAVKERSTLSDSLREKNISRRWIDVIVSSLKPHVNFKRIKGGPYRIIMDPKGELVKFIYEASSTEVYEVEKNSNGYVARKKEVPLDTYLVKVTGEIRSSLFEAMDAAGEEDQLTLAFAEVLAWEVDFFKDLREGDRFKVVVEKVYKGDEFIRYGPIQAVEYQKGEKTILGIACQGDFYNEKGVSFKRAFLKAPLRFNRISSRFSQGRRHPILGGTLPHLGVDYAAPIGTPIWAVGDGTVISCDWHGGFGKQVILRHQNGYMTYYGHLSAYGPGIRAGKRVKQKQIIGYVGSTGLSTGPHLDYRWAKDGRFRNPLKEKSQEGVPIAKGALEKFKKTRDELMGWLQGDRLYVERVEEGKNR